MPIRPGRWFAAVAAAVALVLPLSVGAQEYRFSPVNQYGIKMTAEYWNPIIDYVSEKSGIKIVLKIGRTSAETTAMVLQQEVEFVFSNHLFSPEREKLGWKVTSRRDTPPIFAQIVVPGDSTIRELADLAGQEVAFPGAEALVAYKMTYAELLARKIDVRVVFAGNMDAAIVQAFSGKTRAVGANSQLIEGYAKRESKSYRVLWTSEPLHDLALNVSGKVPARDAAAVTRAFVEMANDPRGREIMVRASKLVGLPENTRFIASDGHEYATYRNFFKTAPLSLQ